MAKVTFKGLNPYLWQKSLLVSVRSICTIALALIVSVSLSACGGSDDEPKQPPKQTTFTIKSNSNAQQIAQDYGLTAKVNYVIYEYNDSNELINFQDWNDIKDGVSTKTFIAHVRATKLVIRMDVKYSDGKKDLGESMYVATVFYLNLNGNVIIDIDGSTVRVSKYNPLD